MGLIVIPIVVLLAVGALMWISGIVFLRLDRKTGNRIGGPVIGLGVLIGLLTEVVTVKAQSTKGPGGWGYGDFYNLMLVMVSPVFALIGFWVVLGAGCIVKAYMTDCRPIRGPAFSLAAVFLIIPALIGAGQIYSAVWDNSLEAKAEKWTDFVVHGRTDPSADELHEIENNPEIRELLITAITWGSNDYAAAWKFFWGPLVAESPDVYLELLLRHGSDAGQIRGAVANALGSERLSFRLIQDNPLFKDSQLAIELMKAATSDPFGMTEEQLKNDLENRLGVGNGNRLESYWQLRQWDRLASSGSPDFDVREFEFWMLSPERDALRNDLKAGINSDPFRAINLTDPRILSILVADCGLGAFVDTIHKGSNIPWSEHEWQQFLTSPIGRHMISRYQDWLHLINSSRLLWISTGNSTFATAAKLQLKLKCRAEMLQHWRMQR